MRVSYLGLWVAGRRNFPCYFGWILSTGTGFSNLPVTRFSRFTSIFNQFFPVFGAICPIFFSFYASGYFINPQFLLCLSFGLLVTP